MALENLTAFCLVIVFLFPLWLFMRLPNLSKELFFVIYLPMLEIWKYHVCLLLSQSPLNALFVQTVGKQDFTVN